MLVGPGAGQEEDRQIGEVQVSNDFLMSDSLVKAAPDLVALQADLEPLVKTAANPFFKSKYAPLPEVAEALKPILAKHHFSLPVFPTVVDTPSGPVNGLRFMLLHKSGEFLSGVWMLNPAQATPQGEGADTTYKRRFGIQSITGLVADDDDDGHTASMRNGATRPAAPKTAADVKRDQLRKWAAEKGFDLKRVADKYSEVTLSEGAQGDLRTASADDIEAFLTSLEAGVVTL